MPSCVYCGQTDAAKFNAEHVIPRAFGKFLDQSNREALIEDRVCTDCNNSFSSFERRHAQESPEAFHRAIAKVKGRRPKKEKPNPYIKKEDGNRPIRLKANREGQEIFMRIDPDDGLVELTSAQFNHPITNELTAVDLKQGMTREQLKAELNRVGYEDGGELRIYCRDNERQWVQPLVSNEGIKWNQPEPGTMRVEVDAGLRKEDFRGIVKIAFNYAMKFNPLGLTGHESCFEAVRRFIRHNEGSIWDFCAISEPRFGPADFTETNHLIKFEATPEKGLVVVMQLFASPTVVTNLHEVILAPYPFDPPKAPVAIFHRFQIDAGSTDSGRVIQLER